MQSAENNRNTNRNHGKEHQRDQVAGKNVGPKTNREGEQPGSVADQLDWQHERCKGRDRSEKMFQIADSRMLETLCVIVQKRTNCTAQRHGGHAGRRLKSRNQSNQIANQNEDENNGKKRRVGLAVMPDNLRALPQYKSLDPLN